MGIEIFTFLSMGSNLGDRMLNLDNAETLIRERVGRVVSFSRTFESASWGYNSENLYYNRCLSLHTSLEAPQLMDTLLAIEKILGRKPRVTGYTDRLIDIDLLLYGDYVIEEPGLSVPHPKMSERRFVLAPLAEIAADVKHPIAGYSMAELLDRCKDPATIRPV